MKLAAKAVPIVVAVVVMLGLYAEMWGNRTFFHNPRGVRIGSWQVGLAP